MAPPKKSKKTNVPENRVDEVVVDYRALGATVEKHQNEDDTWNVSATFPTYKAVKKEADADDIDSLPHNLNRVLELISAGRLPEAESAVSQWIKQHPDDVEAYLVHIEILNDLGNYEAAAKRSNEAMSRFPKHLQIHYARAETLQKVGDVDGATKNYRRSLELFPEDSGLLSGLAALEEEINKLKKPTKKEIKKTVKRAPRAKRVTAFDLGKILPGEWSDDSLKLMNVAVFYATQKRRGAGTLTATCVLFALVDTFIDYRTPAGIIASIFAKEDTADYAGLRGDYLKVPVDSAIGVVPKSASIEPSPNMKKALLLAQKTAIKANHRAVFPEHLFAAMLSVKGQLHHRLKMIKPGVDRLRPLILENLGEFFQDRPDEWEALFGITPDEVLEPVDLPETDLIAQFNSDVAEQATDRLHIQRYVDAFARVIASKSLNPPLSIGLFGDWGSGKTFFMNLMNQAIGKLAEEGNSDIYHGNVCQIRFNAWHYADVDLWASLVSTIFQELQCFLDRVEPNSFDRLLKKLNVVEDLHAEAKEVLKTAQGKLIMAEGKTIAAQGKLDARKDPPMPKRENHDAILLKSLKGALEDQFSDVDKIVEISDTAIKGLGKMLGRDDLKALKAGSTVKDAQDLIANARAMTGRIDFWWRALAAAELYKTWWIWAVGIAALAILVAGVSFDKVTVLGGAAADALLLGSAGLAWARIQFQKAGGWLDHLDRLQVAVESRVQKAVRDDEVAHSQALETYRGKEQDARDHVAQALREEQKLANEVETATKRVIESTSQARLGNFIRQRAADADYEKHLGIISTIHKDFDTLSKLMLLPQDELPEDLKQVAFETGDARVDRIVLYIDDLDRCPADKVVKVLEAVHLMLFFPLFVVVVGVDARWVSRALYKHYNDLLVDQSLSEKEKRQATANSQDYLEKIFQVPFWLRRMDPSGVKRLIESLVSEDERVVDPPPAPGEGQLQPVPTPNESDRANDENGEEADDDKTKEDKIQRDNIASRVSEAEKEKVDENGGMALDAEALRITEPEFAYMKRVSSLMPRSPRSVKRFVNIYRIYKASLSPQGLARFLGTPSDPGNYRAVQVLLALVTGTPQLAKAVYLELDAQVDQDRKLSDLVRDIRVSADDTESWLSILEALEHSDDRRDFDLLLTELQEVAPLVSRYSVHHMVSSTPGASARLG